MKNLVVLTVVILLFSGCDPTATMEATIRNLTSQSLAVEFISSSDERINKTLQILPDERELFQDGFDVGSTYIEPSLREYDSIVVRNQAAQILKVYKPNDTGKNIYNIDEYWKSSEPSKRSFKYEYEIENKDIE